MFMKELRKKPTKNRFEALDFHHEKEYKEK
jgi:hypothetical protein